MNSTIKQHVERFFTAIEKGELPADVMADDVQVWTLTSGATDRDRFASGVRALAAIFGGTLNYHIDRLVEEGNCAIAETRSSGTLTNGEAFANVHVFAFDFTGGRISGVREYMNPEVVQRQIVPLMKALMAGQSR